MSHQRFRPICGLLLQMGETSFEFLPHPSFPDEKERVFCLEGGTAFLYKTLNVESGEFFALKVFKPEFRTGQIAAIAASLTPYKELDALQVTQRRCLIKMAYPELISSYPELEDAILMPWLSAPSWAELLLTPQLSAAYTREQALSLARATASTLSELELHGLAHADLAGKHVVPTQDWQSIHLLDLEKMYLPELPPPPQKSQGTPGYQHRLLGSQGQWRPEGDRFAGAILLTEMLTWWNPRVRAYVDEQAASLFQPADLQAAETPRRQVVRETLHTLSPHLQELFDQAWFSRSLAECPPLCAWAAALDWQHAFASQELTSGPQQDTLSLVDTGPAPEQAPAILPEHQTAQPVPVLVETHTPPAEPIFVFTLPVPGAMDTPPTIQTRLNQVSSPILTPLPIDPATARRKSSSTRRKILLLALLTLVILAGSSILLFRGTAHSAPQLRPTSTTSEQSLGGSNGITVVISPTIPGQTPGAKSTSTTGIAPGSTPTIGSTSTTGSSPQPTAAPTPTAVPTPRPTPTPTPKPPGCLTHNWTMTLSPTYAAGGLAFYVSSYCKGIVYLKITTVPASDGHEVDFQICYGLRTTNCSAWLAYPGLNVWGEVASGLKAGQVFYINGRCQKCTGSSFVVDGTVKY